MSLRRWQRAALRKVMAARSEGKGHVLIAACPGAGKTRFTVEVWQSSAADDCEVIVVVVPSRALKRQWADSFAAAGFHAQHDLDNQTLENAADFGGPMYKPSHPVQVYTYAQIASCPDLFRALCYRHKAMVVFDEIHHADDDETFGRALITAFEGAAFRMSLSGTPFNTKGGKLAFCEVENLTDDDGRPIARTLADFTYSYGEALAATGDPADDPYVVRPVQFVRWNGIARWQRFDTKTGQTEERSVSGSKKSDPLWPLLDMDGDYMKNMLDAAAARLSEVREHHANAGMLITAMDRDHCEAIAAYLNSKGYRDVRVIMHDTPNASAAIRQFEESKDRFLVAIRMISEGVDIKRLRVGVYASNILTQMFFVQFVGRFIRWDGSLPASQYASVFIPEHVTLIKFAMQIERMVVEAEEAIGGNPGGDDNPAPASSAINVGLVSAGCENGIIERHDPIEQDEAQMLRDALQRAGLAAVISEGAAKRLFDSLKSSNPLFAEASKPKQAESSISKKNDQLVAAIVRESDRRGQRIGFDVINRMANDSVGISTKDKLTPNDVLSDRLEFLKQYLTKLRRAEDAAA